MQELVNSFQSSDLLNALKSKNKNPFTYSYEKNFPNGIKISKVVEPEIKGLSFGSEISFPIPKLGYLNNVILTSNLTVATDETAVALNLGANLWEWIELRASDKVIQRITPEYIVLRIHEKNEALRDKIDTIINPSSPLNISSGCVCTPLFFFCFDSFHLNFDTFFMENLSVVAKLKTNYLEMGFVNALPTSITNSIQCEFVKLAEKPPTKDYNVLGYKSILWKKVALDSGATSYKFPFESDKDVFAIHFVIRNYFAYYDVEKLKVYYNNQIVSEKSKEMNALSGGWSSDFIDASETALGTFSHWFSLNKDRQQNSMTINSKLASIDMELEFASIGSGYTLYILVEYFNISCINPYGIIEN